MRWMILLLIVLVTTLPTLAQTETPVPTETETPTATSTPTVEPYVYMTLPPPEGTTVGIMSRFEYTASAGDVQIANLLTMQLLSTWGMFLFAVLVLTGRRK